MRESRPIRAVGGHRVEAVGDDEEVRRERQVVAADAVIAAAVHSLVMKLDSMCLRGDELEALQQTRGQPWVPAHRCPLRPVEAAGLAQQRCVDGNLAEVVQPACPSESVDLRERKLQRTCKLVHVARNPQRVPIGGRVALVDDVGEGLERAQCLALQALQSHLHLLHGDRDGNEHRHVPGMADGEQRERRAEPNLSGSGHEPRIERLMPANDVQQKSPRSQIGEGERNKRDEVIEKMQAADASTCDFEGEAAQASGDRARARIEGDGAESPPAEHSSRKHSRRRDQSAGPGAEHDDRPDLHGSGEPEAFPLHGLARALAIGVLEELHEDDGRQKEGEGRVGDARDPRERDSEHAEAEGDRDQSGARRPHTAPIGQNVPPA